MSDLIVTADPLLVVDDLVVEYESEGYSVRPLDGFSLTVERGELVALLGPSGSGKTTLLSVLSAMVPATSGTVSMNGIDVLKLQGTALEQYRRNQIGIVFQGFNLIPSLNAVENVAAPLLIARKDRKAALAKAHDLLHEVGMADRAKHMPSEMSGGQQQRVAVARGLIGDPVLLLADEPTANLDVISAEAVVSLLRRLRDSGRSIVISTHDNRLLPAVDRSVEMAPHATDAVSAPAPMSFNKGEVIFRQSDQSDYVYLIDEGSVDVIREFANGDRETLATLHSGNYVGELGPLLGFPRSATIEAATDVVLTPLTIGEFKLRGLQQVTADA